MNVPLLREIQARILAEPDAFRMDVWSCGTAHCIAGWALLLNGTPVAPRGRDDMSPPRTVDGRDPREAARLLLGLPPDEDGEIGDTDRLFLDTEWPDAFMVRHRQAVNQGDRQLTAQIAAARIDHFIATEGRE